MRTRTVKANEIAIRALVRQGRFAYVKRAHFRINVTAYQTSGTRTWAISSPDDFVLDDFSILPGHTESASA